MDVNHSDEYIQEYLPFFRGLNPNITPDKLKELMSKYDDDFHAISNAILEEDSFDNLPESPVASPVQHNLNSPHEFGVESPHWTSDEEDEVEDDWKSIREEQDKAFQEALKVDQKREDRENFENACIDFMTTSVIGEGNYMVKLRLPNSQIKVVNMPYSEMTYDNFILHIGIPNTSFKRCIIKSQFEVKLERIRDGNTYYLFWQEE